MKKLITILAMTFAIYSCKFIDESKLTRTWNIKSIVNNERELIEDQKILITFEKDGFYSLNAKSKTTGRGSWRLYNNNKIRLTYISGYPFLGYSQFAGSYSFSSGVLTFRGVNKRDFITLILSK